MFWLHDQSQQLVNLRYIITKVYKPNTLTAGNVRLSNLLISVLVGFMQSLAQNYIKPTSVKFPRWSQLHPAFILLTVYILWCTRLICHNFINSQHLLMIFGRNRPHSYINWFGKKFLNWLRTRTSCVVAITIVVTCHTRTTNFLADFELRVFDRAINK